jgi:hypothetical protein
MYFKLNIFLNYIQMQFQLQKQTVKCFHTEIDIFIINFFFSGLKFSNKHLPEILIRTIRNLVA